MSSPTDFYVSREKGFLSESPVGLRLPPQFSAIEELGRELPKFLVSDQLRSRVEKLPSVDVSGLTSRDERERLMTYLSFIGHAYVFGHGNPPQRLPAALAKPWYDVAHALGRPPVLSYASYMLHNWRRIDPKRPIELGNVCLIQNFLGGIDEEWFILVHCEIEAEAGEALFSLWEAQDAVAARDMPGTTAKLTTVGNVLEAMWKTLCRMVEHCDPYIYYNRVRPYIHGWKNNPALPQGIIYDGVDAYKGAPQQFRGETGSQSSIVPSMDAGLGIHHRDDPLRPYLEEMKEYMPPEHRMFLKALESRPSVREFVQANVQNSELKNAYNSCVRWLAEFRSKHLEYASEYIFKQNEKSKENPHAIGTGGTPFMQYLAKHRDETGEHKL